MHFDDAARLFVSRRDLLGSMSEMSLRRAVRAGQVIPLGGEWFRRTDAEAAPWFGELAALLLRAGTDAVVSRAAAAALWDLDGFSVGEPLTVRVPHRVRSGLDDPRVHRSRDDSGVATTVRNRWPVSSVDRTLVELGTGLTSTTRWPLDRSPIEPIDRVELALECALRQRWVTIPELEALLASRGRASQPGARFLRAVLDRRPLGAPPTESYLETRAVQVFRRNDLATPRRQVEIHDESGRFIARVDFLFQPSLVVEADGREHHAATFQRDRERWDELTRLGYVVLVFTYDDVERRPQRTAQVIRDTLARTAA